MGRTNWHLFIKSSHTSLWVTITIRSNQRRVSDFLLLDTVEECVVWVIQGFGEGQYLTCHAEDTLWGILNYTSLPFPHTFLSVSALGMLSSLTVPARLSPWKSHPQINITLQLCCAMHCSETRDKDKMLSLGKLKFIPKCSMNYLSEENMHLKASPQGTPVSGGCGWRELFPQRSSYVTTRQPPTLLTLRGNILVPYWLPMWEHITPDTVVYYTGYRRVDWCFMWHFSSLPESLPIMISRMYQNDAPSVSLANRIPDFRDLTHLHLSAT